MDVCLGDGAGGFCLSRVAIPARKRAQGLDSQLGAPASRSGFGVEGVGVRGQGSGCRVSTHTLARGWHGFRSLSGGLGSQRKRRHRRCSEMRTKSHLETGAGRPVHESAAPNGSFMLKILAPSTFVYDCQVGKTPESEICSSIPF